MPTFPAFTDPNGQNTLLLQALLQQLKTQQMKQSQSGFNPLQSLAMKQAARAAASNRPMTPIIQNIFNRGGVNQSRSGEGQNGLLSALSSGGSFFGQGTLQEENIEEQQRFPFSLTGVGTQAGFPPSVSQPVQSFQVDATKEAFNFAKDNPEIIATLTQILLAAAAAA